MFMRASPVHTYLLDEVLADMIGIHQIDPRIKADCGASARAGETASAAANEIAPVSEAAEPDPLKAPMVKASASHGVKLPLFLYAQFTSASQSLQFFAAHRVVAPLADSPSAPPCRNLPLLI